MKPVPLTERRFIAPLALITSLFFLWALGVNLNDVLIPHLKKAFRLTDLQSSLIQTAFFGGYFLAALPAGRLMERIGYKKGILTGLLLCASGALLFIPAATVLAYGFFLFALFVMACGQSFLEVAANPYVTALGPKESAERRLNLAQSFNAVGAVITPFVGAAFILTNTQSGSARVDEASTVRIPYLIIAAIFLSVATMIYSTHLPEVHENRGEENLGDQRLKLADVWKFQHLRQGVLAQFFYVGAQVGVASFVIRLTEQVQPGTPDKTAARYLQLHLLGFMIGRFAGSGLMKYIPAPRLLSIFSAGSLV
jgi:FHS family L-fucose permease-like MFS transporter